MRLTENKKRDNTDPPIESDGNKKLKVTQNYLLSFRGGNVKSYPESLKLI